MGAGEDSIHEEPGRWWADGKASDADNEQIEASREGTLSFLDVGLDDSGCGSVVRGGDEQARADTR